MTNTEKYLDTIDGPADEDLFALDTEADDLFPEDEDDATDSDDLDFDSNYEDDRYSGSGIPSYSAWA